MFEPNEWNFNLKSSDWGGSKIIFNDVKLERISWELNIKKIHILAFAWVFGRVIHIPNETDIPIFNPGIQPLKEKYISWISSKYQVKWIRVKIKTAGEW